MKLPSQDLEAAAAVINQRPLAIHKEGSRVHVVTPAKLAFGSSYNFGGEAIAEFRREFYDRYFLLYRRRQSPTLRRMLLSVSSYVLVSNKAAEWDRTKLLFHVGQIVALGRGFLTIRFTSGKIKDVSTDMVAPLEPYFFADSPSQNVVDSPGDRVEEISASQVDELTINTTQNAGFAEELAEDAPSDGL
jgi:hypothetical protein